MNAIDLSGKVAVITSAGTGIGLGAARCLAQYGITVNEVAPGPIITERSENPPSLSNQAKRVPIGRYGVPADIGWVVAFLASDKAEFITGETIFVDGGLSHRLR